MAFVLLRSCGQ